MTKRLALALLLASLSTGQAANILGTPTPLSKTALCKRDECTVTGNAQVGGYLFVTYATKSSTAPGSGGYFSFLKGGKTVAAGVYGIGSQDSTLVGTPQELQDLVTLTGRSLPNLRGLMSAPGVIFDPLPSGSTPLVLRRDRNVTLPLGAGMVLTNASQRVTLGNNFAALEPSAGLLRFVDVVYVALASEAQPIGRLINRWNPGEQRAAREAYLKGTGLLSACPAKRSNGKLLSFNEVQPNSPLVSWPVARGYTLNSNTFSVAFALPGLALSSVQLSASGGASVQEAWTGPVCVR